MYIYLILIIIQQSISIIDSMQKEAIFEMFRQGMSQKNDYESLVKLTKVVKIISDTLPFNNYEYLASDPDIIKFLFICSPINSESILFLIESLIQKYKSKQYFLFRIWKTIEFISEIEEKEVSLIVTKKVLDFEVEISKNNKVSRIEQVFLLNNIVQIKINVLKIIPFFFKIIETKENIEICEKIQIFKIFKQNCQDQIFLKQANEIYQKLHEKYCTIIQNKKVQSNNLSLNALQEKKKMTTKKILTQKKIVFDRASFQEALKNETEQLFTLIKIQSNSQSLLSFILVPYQIQIELQIWNQNEEIFQNQNDQISHYKNVRCQKSMQLFKDRKIFKKIIQNFPDLYHIFFSLLQSKIGQQLNFKDSLELLSLFIKYDKLSCILLMKYGILEKLYKFMKIECVFNFYHKFLNIDYCKIVSKQILKQIYTNYLKIIEFFPLILTNFNKKKQDHFLPIKNKDLTQIQKNVKKIINERKKDSIKPSLIIEDLSNLKPNQQIYIYKSSKMYLNFFSDHGQNQSNNSSKIQKKNQENIKYPPYAIKQYKGYYSTHPNIILMNFEIDKLDPENFQWNEMNCKFYYELLISIMNLPENEHQKIQMLKIVFPEKKCIEQIFILLKKYLSAYQLNKMQNGSITAIKILNQILSRNIFKYKILSNLCQQYIFAIQKIIKFLFKQPTPPTQIQNIKIVKTLGFNKIEMVQLFLNFVKNINIENKSKVLDQIQDELWQIFILWFFDCMINNIYQNLFYEILNEVLLYCSENLILKIFFKLNMISCLHNAYQDIVKNNVLMSQWHIQSFYNYIIKIYLLIKQIYEKRNNLNNFRANLVKLISWNQLQNNITKRKDNDKKNQRSQFSINQSMTEIMLNSQYLSNKTIFFT